MCVVLRVLANAECISVVILNKQTKTWLLSIVQSSNCSLCTLSDFVESASKKKKSILPAKVELRAEMGSAIFFSLFLTHGSVAVLLKQDIHSSHKSSSERRTSKEKGRRRKKKRKHRSCATLFLFFFLLTSFFFFGCFAVRPHITSQYWLHTSASFFF